MSKELLMHLKSEGYTYLVAEGQASNDWYTFTPVKWDEETFFDNCIYNDFDDHMILSIHEALETFLFEDYLNHEVILPDMD